MKSGVKVVERLAAYLPIVGTAGVLIIQNFFPDFLKSVTPNLAIGAMALSFILLAWYLEGRIERFENGFVELKSSVQNLAEEQPRLLGEASSNYQLMELSGAFREAYRVRPQVSHLRIFALSGSQMSVFLQHSGIVVERCSLM